jgi:hypothetical protein
MDEIESSPDDIQGLYMAIGFIAVKWSFIEQAIDVFVGVTFHILGGKKQQKEIPRMLKEKIRYSKKILRTITALKDFSEEGLALFERIANEKDYRHDFIHSTLVKEKPENGVYYLARIQTEPQVHRVREWQFDVRNFPADSLRLAELTRDTQEYVGRITRHFYK